MKTLCIQLSSLPEEVVPIIEVSLLRVSRWHRPPNWSSDAWMMEIQQVALEAALQAAQDHAAHPGVEFGAFVRLRIMSKVRHYCRKEWRFSWRTAHSKTACECELDNSPFPDIEALPSSEHWPDQAAARREVALLVTTLPRHRQWLVLHLYWLGLSESQVANVIGVDQRTVNRRKAETLDELRSHFAIDRIPVRRQPSLKPMTHPAR